jgi:uncharacterized protein YjbI with pentapeptide repeats
MLSGNKRTMSMRTSDNDQDAQLAERNKKERKKFRDRLASTALKKLISLIEIFQHVDMLENDPVAVMTQYKAIVDRFLKGFEKLLSKVSPDDNSEKENQTNLHLEKYIQQEKRMAKISLLVELVESELENSPLQSSLSLKKNLQAFYTLLLDLQLELTNETIANHHSIFSKIRYIHGILLPGMVKMHAVHHADEEELPLAKPSIVQAENAQTLVGLGQLSFFPNEVLITIFSFISIIDSIKTQSVSKDWQKWVSQCLMLEQVLRAVCESSPKDTLRLIQCLQDRHISDMLSFPSLGNCLSALTSDDVTAILPEHLEQDRLAIQHKTEKKQGFGTFHKSLKVLVLAASDLSIEENKNALAQHLRKAKKPLIVNLAKASLMNANLSGADLTRANLSGTKLVNIDLSEANLSSVDISKTTLTACNLSRCNLFRTKLSKILDRNTLDGAQFLPPNCDKKEELESCLESIVDEFSTIQYSSTNRSVITARITTLQHHLANNILSCVNKMEQTKMHLEAISFLETTLSHYVFTVYQPDPSYWQEYNTYTTLMHNMETKLNDLRKQVKENKNASNTYRY